MKRFIIVAVLASTSFLLAACATPAQQRSPEQAVDQAYVNNVEGFARRFGTEIYWVNPPRGNEETQENG